MSRSAAQPKPGEPITLVKTSKGEVRYRTVLDYAPAGEPRQQRRATFSTLTEARAHVASVKAKRAAGALPTRDRDSFNQLADEYLADRRAHVRAITYGTYVSALKPARDAFGDRSVGKITMSDIEALSRRMAGRGVTARTTKMTLGRVQAVLDRAVKQGAVIRNVAAGVAPLGEPSKSRRAMTIAEYQRVAVKASEHSWAAAWLLTLHGMRRSEVLGLRWQDVDLNGDSPVLHIRHSRTGDSAVLTPTKTHRGTRALPLTDEMFDALRSLRSEVSRSLGLVAIHPEAFVFVNAAGEPIRPEHFSDEWVRLCHATGIKRRVILYEARHTSVTIMRAANVPDRIVAAWHGHDETIMKRTYDHASDDQSALAEAASILGAIRSASA